MGPLGVIWGVMLLRHLGVGLWVHFEMFIWFGFCLVDFLNFVFRIGLAAIA